MYKSPPKTIDDSIMLGCVPSSLDTNTSDQLHSNTTMSQYDSLVHQATLNYKTSEGRDRAVLYATAGNASAPPVLFFAPLGSSRRSLIFARDAYPQFFLICVGRPGQEKGSHPEPSPNLQVQTHCLDILAVLKELSITRASIFCMCAGAPFALAFCSKYPQFTTGKFLAFGPWSLPADCPACNRLDQFAARHLPRKGISKLVGSVFSTMMGFISEETMSSKLSSACCAPERKVLETRYSSGEKILTTFSQDLAWMKGEAKLESEWTDIGVCLSKSQELGFGYDDTSLSIQEILVCQGDEDKIAPVEATRWVVNRLTPTAKSVRMIEIPEGTHQGALFLLGNEYLAALPHLKGQ